MQKKFKKNQKTKKPNKTINKNNKISFEEFKSIVSGLTDEELNLVSDWLSDRQQKP